VDILVHDLKCRYLSNLNEWLLGRGYETILGVVIDKDIYLVALLHIETSKAVGEQNLHTLVIDKVKAKI
jgi:hypothetical protein